MTMKVNTLLLHTVCTFPFLLHNILNAPGSFYLIGSYCSHQRLSNRSKMHIKSRQSLVLETQLFPFQRKDACSFISWETVITQQVHFVIDTQIYIYKYIYVSVYILCIYTSVQLIIAASQQGNNFDFTFVCVAVPVSYFLPIYRFW